jgi:hypothetical protein
VSRFDLGDDEALLKLLGEALDEADPVPAEAVQAALALSNLSDVDAELATLVADTLVQQDVVLYRHEVTMEVDASADRLVSFATPQLNVDVELHANDSSMVGVIMPAGVFGIEVETRRQTVVTRSDDLGRFHVELPPGPFRLHVQAHGGAVVTPWITR